MHNNRDNLFFSSTHTHQSSNPLERLDLKTSQSKSAYSCFIFLLQFRSYLNSTRDFPPPKFCNRRDLSSVTLGRRGE